MNGHCVRIIIVLALSGCVAALVSGCTTRDKAAAQTHEAFIAGQNAALLRQQAQQFPTVTVVGPVQNPTVPWVAGLTLAQAVATANYLGTRAPETIVITRQGESATLNADVLLNGPAIPLEPGDAIELRQEN
jgi:hypothetical protein